MKLSFVTILMASIATMASAVAVAEPEPEAIAEPLAAPVAENIAQPIARGSHPRPSAPKPRNFGVMALRSARPFHYAQASAALGSVWLQYPRQNAKCRPSGKNKNNGGYAVFYIKDGGLYLYNAGRGKTQRLYADRSGMGQGKLGYLTGDEQPPRNGEIKGFKVDRRGNLSLGGAGFLACPSDRYPGSWSVWVESGVTNPGGNKGCIPFEARTLTQKDAAGCQYSKP